MKTMASKITGNGFTSLGRQLEHCRGKLPMAVLDKEMRVVWANGFFCRQVGLSVEFVLGKTLAQLEIACTSVDIGVHFDRIVERSSKVRETMRPSKRSIRWTKVNIVPTAQSHDSIETYLLIKVDDVPDHSEQETENVMQAAIQRAARYRFLLDHQPDLISLCDRFGRRIFVNASYCAFTGKSESELVGTSIRDLPLLGLPMEVIDKVFLLTPQNPEMHGIYPLQNAAREVIWIYGRSRGIFDSKGSLQEILTIGRDVTTLKNAELDKMNYIDDLERIAFMTSHKVRAPIASMMGLLELLRLKGVDSAQWNIFFESFKKCILDLDQCSKEMAAFIYARQSA